MPYKTRHLLAQPCRMTLLLWAITWGHLIPAVRNHFRMNWCLMSVIYNLKLYDFIKANSTHLKVKSLWFLLSIHGAFEIRLYICNIWRNSSEQALPVTLCFFLRKSSGRRDCLMLTRGKFRIRCLWNACQAAQLLQTNTGMDQIGKSLDWNYPHVSQLVLLHPKWSSKTICS